MSSGGGRDPGPYALDRRDADERPSARLLARARVAWERALAAPLIRDMSAGCVDDETLARYFVLESGFVDTAARVRAAAILRAPSMRAARGHYAALGSLLAEQSAVLTGAGEPASSATMSVAQDGRGAALARRVMAVAELGTYEEILCCLLAAESLYAHWCRDAGPSRTRQPVLEQWIELHTIPPFTDELAFLRDEVDGLAVTGGRLTELAALISEILDLERDFHDCARQPECS